MNKPEFLEVPTVKKITFVATDVICASGEETEPTPGPTPTPAPIEEVKDSNLGTWT